MAPKGGAGKAARTSCTTTKPRRKKKKTPFCYNESRRPSDTVPVLSDRGSCEEEYGIKEEDAGYFSNSGCSTPKGEGYKIPEIGTCPPAPKKHRPGGWSRGRRLYFVSPEIEAFFLLALGGISV